MLLKFICCDVFTRMACDIVSRSPHTIDLEFLPMLAHDTPEILHKELQQRIDRSTLEKQYDKLILGYGLCGNATAGLNCSVPMIIPRIHDCCTMFMGSKDNYLKEFGNSLSMPWCTNGYFERCYAENNISDYSSMTAYKTTPEYMQLVEQYDEENAEYIWKTLHPISNIYEAVYIQMDEYELNNTLLQFKERVEKNGNTLKVLKGDISFFEKLVNGSWDDNIFLEVLQGEKIVPIYDMEQVISAK